MKAVHYIRWSSDKQSSGSTLYRQKKFLDEFSGRMGWPCYREIRDEAVSAYFGDNIDEGNLGDFIRLCEAEGGHGVVLVCEMISRISRLNPLDALLNINRMIDTGLTVAIADHAMIIDKHSIRNQRAQLIAIVESQDKAYREIDDRVRLIRSAWQCMRDNGRPVHCSSTCPAWLELDAKRTKFLPISELGPTALYRIALLNELFDLYLAGHGFRTIARMLNARGEETWRGGSGWQASAVRALIQNRAVIGEYQHRVGGQPVDDPVPDYFPQVVSNEKFALANEAGHRRIMSSHSRTSKLMNLVSDVARCAVCGGRMSFRNKSRRKDGQPVAYLQCDTYSRGLACSAQKMVAYYPLEEALLDTVLDKILDDQHFRSGDEVAAAQQAVADKQRIIDDANLRIENVGNMIERHSGNATLNAKFEGRLLAAISDLDDATRAMAVAQADLQRATGRANRSEHISRVADIRAGLRTDDEDVRRRCGRLVKMAINDYVERIDVDPVTGVSTVKMIGPIGDFRIIPGRKVSFFDLLHPWRNHDYSGRVGEKLIAWTERRNRAA